MIFIHKPLIHTIVAHMSEAKHIRVFMGFKEVTNVTFSAELCTWPYMPIWGEVSIFVRGKSGFVMGDDGPEMTRKFGFVWWKRR